LSCRDVMFKYCLNVSFRSRQEEGSIYSVYTLNKRMIHVSVKIEWNGTRFHHATQNNLKL
jgi:hypothetical protein